MPSAPAAAPAESAPPAAAGGDAPRRSRVPADWPALVGLAVVLVAGLALRLVSIGHGLPFSFHADEAFHFTKRAIAMVRHGDLDPRYFQNPSGFTELVYVAERVRFLAFRPFGSGAELLARWRTDPTPIWVTARVVAALTCMVGVAAVFAVGRRLWNASVGLVAAALLSFAFLPVAYSRYALTDVGVFAPVALAALAVVLIAEDGRRRWFVAAGAAVGLACGFKYTAGVLVVPLALAVVVRARRDEALAVLVSAALAVAAAVVVFLVTTPYFALDLDRALYQIKVQARNADVPKVGQAREGPFGFYLHSLTWGLGWAAAVAAALGVVLEARRRPWRALLLALVPVVLFAYLCTGERYFARWMLPAYPVLALFAGIAVARVAAALAGRPAIRAGVLVLLTAGLLVQPLVADVHVAKVLGRTDTRQLTRDFLARTLPDGGRFVVEPAVPARWTPPGRRAVFGPPPKSATLRWGSVTRFILDLSPARLERYRRAGACTVVTMSDVSDRARATTRRRAAVLGYYRALRRQGRVVFRASPYRRGAEPVPFDFDLSTHLYVPRAFERPGPDVTVYRLRGCREATRS
jgi:Dolichyl-phosphate-mannose-protein mannosyltransferase